MDVVKQFYGAISMNVTEGEFILDKGKIELRYYKIIGQPTEKNNRRYGIEVIKKCLNNNIFSEERKEIYNCIEKEDVADKVLELLKENRVSPINVVDILEDISSKRKSLYIK